MIAAKNILLIRFKSIGDVILTLPAVIVMRENFPGARITFLTVCENAPLLQGFRNVDQIIAIDRAKLRGGNPLKVVPEFFGLLRRLRTGKFSLVVDFQGYGETAWLARLTGAPARWGSVYGPGREWLYTCGVPRDDSLQIADWNLSLLRQCGLKISEIKNEFVLPKDAVAAARRFFATNNLDPAKPSLFLQPFTSVPVKNWPLEHYLELARYSQSRGVQIIFGGGPGDRTALEPARGAGFPVAAGLPLLDAAGLISLSTVTVGGVTGLLHLAVAMQKRVVMLIGPKNEPGFPYQHRDWGLMPDTGSKVADIQVPAVINACEKAFRESAGNIFRSTVDP